MQIGAIVGLLGDSVAFVGGIVLALDAISKEREFRRIKNIASAIKSPPLAKLTVEMDGILLSGEDDVEKAFIHNSARKAVIGAALLSGGFLLIIAGRILEHLK